MLRSIVNSLAVLVLIGASYGCAASAPLPTPSGRPEVTINASRAQIKSQLIESFATGGYHIRDETESSILFTRQLDPADGAIYRAFLGTRYSSEPEWEIRVTIVDSGGATRLFANAEVVMQNAFGRVDRNNYTHGRHAAELQSALQGLKLQVEAGNILEGRGKIGVHHTEQIVTMVIPNGPAARAGLRAGDRLMAANGTPLTGDLKHDALLITGPPGTPVVLDVERSGRSLTIEVVRGDP